MLGSHARYLGFCLSRHPPTTPFLAFPSSSSSFLSPCLFSTTSSLLSKKGNLDYDEWEEKISSFLDTEPPAGDHHKEFHHDQLSSSFENFFEAQDEEKLTLSHYHNIMLSLLKNGLNDEAITVYYALKESDCEPDMRTFKLLSRAITAPLKEQRLRRFHEEKDPFDSYESLFHRLKEMKEEDLEDWGSLVEEGSSVGEEDSSSDGLSQHDCWPEWPEKVCYAKKNDKNKENCFLFREAIEMEEREEWRWREDWEKEFIIVDIRSRSKEN
eukprot:CAMPEP_0201531792 /NCGR_PEP_ID=MMETSP0161_2-20130828/48628_1 /ASSEMBLY_ACC=CAM_ASM_000251 /TAXON_ID=180227 /ORGANISM="Neoparamoeba aestuarina, Strain SoJaBio B1-5/56/2" /LENGTH=268 /DNA_ID=CAMNT_0047934881 /DNA_START=55 /DNA_END=859 /DNA_ORIENTATION=-